MESHNAPRNIPAHVLKEVREQEARQLKEGLLGGLIREDGQSTPLPERTARVADIRWGKGVR